MTQVWVVRAGQGNELGNEFFERKVAMKNMAAGQAISFFKIERRDDLVRKVDVNGKISYRNQTWRIGKAFITQRIGLRASPTDGVLQVLFAGQTIGTLDLQEPTKAMIQPMTTRFRSCEISVRVRKTMARPVRTLAPRVPRK